MEEILHKVKRFRLLDEEARKRVEAKVRDALPYLNKESRPIHIYAFTEREKRRVASTDGKQLLVYPPLTKGLFMGKVLWAIIGDLGVFGETDAGEPFLFPSYAKGPGKVLAIVWRGKIYHRGGAYVRRSE